MARHSCQADDTYASGLLQQRNYSKAYQACNSKSGVEVCLLVSDVTKYAQQIDELASDRFLAVNLDMIA